MPAYAPNFTAKYTVDYSSLGRRYSVGFRFTSTAATPTAGEIAAVKAILDAAAGLRYTDWVVEGAEWVAQGSAVSVPVTAPVVVAGTAALPAQPVAARPQAISWVGRSFGGSRAVVYLFGVNTAIGVNAATADYRLTVNESAPIAAVRNALVNAGASGLCAIDGGAVAWKNYANLGYNSYQIKRARGV